MRIQPLLLILSGILALACGNEPKIDDYTPCEGELIDGKCVTKQACTIDEECLPVAVCLDGFCGHECTVDKDCPGILECVFYRCVVEGRGEDVAVEDAAEKVPCTKHVECDPYEMACIDGFCDRECTKDWQCDGPDMACVGYMCKAVEPPAPDVTDAVTEPDLPPGCDPKNGPYGAACTCAEECSSSLCIQNKRTQSAMCTQYCQNDAQCPGNDICIGLGTAEVCILNDSGEPTSCDPNQALCYKGLFLTNKLGKCACTVPCTKASDCPDGQGCHVLGADKVCVTTGETCGSGYNPCFGECAGDPNSGVGFCTNLCITSTDCPNNWTCQSIGQGVSVCASPF